MTSGPPGLLVRQMEAIVGGWDLPSFGWYISFGSI